MKVKGVMKLPNSFVIFHLKGDLSFKMKKLPKCWVISSLPLLYLSNEKKDEINPLLGNFLSPFPSTFYMRKVPH